MATPRSEKGFLKAISEAEDNIKDLDEKLTDATGDEETQLLEEKADAEVELAMLTQKFEEFQAKSDDEPEEEPQAEDEPEKPVEEKKTEVVKPKKVYRNLPEIDSVVMVNVLRGGYMVNPHTHDKFIQNEPKKAIIDHWMLSQIEAKIMAVVTDEG